MMLVQLDFGHEGDDFKGRDIFYNLSDCIERFVGHFFLLALFSGHHRIISYIV
jgi:hypothetical protein